MPLQRTYASLNLDMLDTAQPSPALPSPTLMRTVMQPTIKNPTTSSHRRFYPPPRHSSLLGKIIPPFKPGRNLYRRVLKREFLRATKKAMNDTETLTTDDVTTDDQWPVAA